MEKLINLVENYFVKNEAVLPTVEFHYNFKENYKILYEVIRVKKSSPIFFNQHLERLEKSVNLLEFFSPDIEKIRRMVVELIKANPVTEKNIRISLVYNNTSSTPDLLIYFIPSVYPSSSQRKSGVIVKTLLALRENPNAKVENKTLRIEADRIIKEIGCYEVLLVNNDGFITEGSRSNVFFLKNESIITPPLNMVLGGITRQIVIELTREVNIPIIETTVKIDEINKFDGAFITGTSPGLLPISKIDDICFDVKSVLLNKLTAAYEAAIKDSILKFKTNQK